MSDFVTPRPEDPEDPGVFLDLFDLLIGPTVRLARQLQRLRAQERARIIRRRRAARRARSEVTQTSKGRGTS